MRYVTVVVFWSVICGCNAPPRHWGSTVTVSGVPAAGNVLFVNGKEQVVAQAAVVNGRYELPTPPAALIAIFRLEAPYLGIREVKLKSDAPPALDIDKSDVLTIHAAIEVPKLARFDFVDVEITPHGDNDLPWSIKQRLTTPHAELRLLSGDFSINMSGATSDPGGAPLVLDHIEEGQGGTGSRLRSRTGGILFLHYKGSFAASFVMRGAAS